jgi:hypothetical protein
MTRREDDAISSNGSNWTMALLASVALPWWIVDGCRWGLAGQQLTQSGGGVRGRCGGQDHQVQTGRIWGRQAVLFHVELAHDWVAEQALSRGQCFDVVVFPRGTERFAALDRV